MDYDYDYSFLKTLIGVVSGIVLLMAVLFYIGTMTNEYSCFNVGSRMEVASEYHLSTGCMVEINHKWYPLSSVKVTP